MQHAACEYAYVQQLAFGCEAHTALPTQLTHALWRISLYSASAKLFVLMHADFTLGICTCGVQRQDLVYAHASMRGSSAFMINGCLSLVRPDALVFVLAINIAFVKFIALP